VGNKRLSFKDSTDIRLTFTRDGYSLELILKRSHLDFLAPLFSGAQLNQEQLSDLANRIATINENELFLLREAASSTQPTF